MREFVKKSLATTVSYGAGVFVFVFFLIAPMSMENNKYIWLMAYSFVFFVFTVSFLYKNTWKKGSTASMGEEEKRPLVKGLMYGFAGFSPLILMEILYFIFYPAHMDSFAGNVMHAVFRCSFGPLYFIIRLLGYTWYAYLIASLVIPAVAAVGYLAGYRKTNLPDLLFPSGKDREDFLDI